MRICTKLNMNIHQVVQIIFTASTDYSLGRMNYLQKILEKKLYIILQYKIIIYLHTLRRSMASIDEIICPIFFLFSCFPSALMYFHAKVAIQHTVDSLHQEEGSVSKGRKWLKNVKAVEKV